MNLLDSLFNDSSTSKSLLDPGQLLSPLMPFIIFVSIVSLIVVVLYIVNSVTTYRSHKAMIETRDILREMNERDKNRIAIQAAAESPEQNQ